jgi:hypothetical protein
MKYLKKIFESQSVEELISDIKEILNDIEDWRSDIFTSIKVEESLNNSLGKPHINIMIDAGRSYFKIDDDIKSSLQSIDLICREEYRLMYQYRDNWNWNKFYVYHDDRGIRNYSVEKIDGTGRTPAPPIKEIKITLVSK